jgi:hypothetical protein
MSVEEENDEKVMRRKSNTSQKIPVKPIYGTKSKEQGKSKK